MTQEERMSVVVADDHVPTRTGVRAALEQGGFDVLADVGTAQAAIDAAIEHNPDVCLLDVRMPGDGIAAAAEIKERSPNVRVVMLTVSADDENLFDALRAGASGYLLKDTNPERLPFALRGVLSGEAAVPRLLVARLIEEFRDRGRRERTLRHRQVELTPREAEVLEFLRSDLPTKEIAARLRVSEITVRRHVGTMLKKLGVSDRAAAVRMIEEDEA